MNWEFLWSVVTGCVIGMIAVIIIFGLNDIVVSTYVRALK